MELGILFGVLFAIYLLLMPIIALVAASAASKRSARLERRVQELELEQALARRPAAAADPEPEQAVPAAAGETPPAEAEEKSEPEPADEKPEPAEPAEPEAEPAPTTASAPTPAPLPKEVVTAAPPIPAVPAAPKKPGPLEGINWEHFMGAKLFAWIGGLALFLGIAFFVKYAFDRDLIPPEVRVALGFVAGLGLMVGGFLLDRNRYTITAHTLCATGVMVLYATTFACRSIYHFAFFGVVPTFLLMALITATAFLLAVRLNAILVAVLGLAGGFLTPPLLSTGVDNPLGLFGYVGLLNVGLVAVALHRRWHFLVPLAALGTIATQWGWCATFFTVSKAWIGLAVFLVFAAFFLGAASLARRLGRGGGWFAPSAAALAGSAFAFALACLTFREIATTPALVLAAVFVPSLCLAALSLLWPRWPVSHAAGAVVGFFLLALWLGGTADREGTLLPWMLGACLGFAVLHTAFPLVVERLGLERRRAWLHLFPLLALVLVLFPVATIEGISLMTWPVVFAITGLAVAASLVARTPWAIAVALLLTLIVLAVWIGRVPAEVGSIWELVGVIGVFAVAIFAALFVFRERIQGEPGEGAGEGRARWEAFFDGLTPHLPAASAALPFALLMLVVDRFPLANPSPLFGLVLVLVTLLLGLATFLPQHVLPLVGLACAAGLQQVWQGEHLGRAVAAGTALTPLVWHLVFFAAFAAYPFFARRRHEGSLLPWIASALSGPLHFFLVHKLIKAAWPNEFMGLVPALFAVPSLAALVFIQKRLPAAAKERPAQLAWFGGVTLLFITLIFPIQFSREWITIGWALEGTALCWLYGRLGHPGLRLTGLALLAVAFVRLALNPAVLSYHERGAMPILNWLLYTYGVAAACFFAAAWLLRPPRERVFGVNVPPLLYALGTILAFLLVNIEIADFFAEEGKRILTFDVSGNFARDMTYTIAWSLFALGLLVVGLVRKLRAARLAGIALLAVALLKLFFHDLASLEALYRIGALIGTAVIAIFASFLYQKLQSNLNPEPAAEIDEDVPPAPAAPPADDEE